MKQQQAVMSIAMLPHSQVWCLSTSVVLQLLHLNYCFEVSLSNEEDPILYILIYKLLKCS